MALLVFGVLLWAFVHLVPTIEQPLKRYLVARFGENGYRGVFSLAIVVAIVCIVLWANCAGCCCGWAKGDGCSGS